MHTGHPSNEARQRLANQLHMSPKSVQVWFQNRRQKLRGQQQAMTNAAGNNDACSVRVAAHPAASNVEMGWSHPTSIDADRRETVQPYAMQATPRVVPAQSAAAYDPGAGAGAAPMMHPAQGYALPRPGDFHTTTLPAHILSELASVSAAEQDLALFARQLMQRKVELLDNIQRLEQQTAASRHSGHAVVISPAYPATQAVASLADFPSYKKYKQYKEECKEAHETFQPSEPFQATPPSPPPPPPLPAVSRHPQPSRDLVGDACPLLTVTPLHLAGAGGGARAAPVRGLRCPGVLLALPAVRIAAGCLAIARYAYAAGQGRRVGRYAPR